MIDINDYIDLCDSLTEVNSPQFGRERAEEILNRYSGSVVRSYFLHFGKTIKIRDAEHVECLLILARDNEDTPSVPRQRVPLEFNEIYRRIDLNGIPAGFYTLVKPRFERIEGNIEYVYVSPEQRGQNLGKVGFLDACLCGMYEQKVDRLKFLAANPLIWKMLEKMGIPKSNNSDDYGLYYCFDFKKEGEFYRSFLDKNLFPFQIK